MSSITNVHTHKHTTSAVFCYCGILPYTKSFVFMTRLLSHTHLKPFHTTLHNCHKRHNCQNLDRTQQDTSVGLCGQKCSEASAAKITNTWFWWLCFSICVSFFKVWIESFTLMIKHNVVFNFGAIWGIKPPRHILQNHLKPEQSPINPVWEWEPSGNKPKTTSSMNANIFLTTKWKLSIVRFWPWLMVSSQAASTQLSRSFTFYRPDIKLLVKF